MLKVETVDIKDIHDQLRDLNISVASYNGKFDMHIANQAIHQNPPCKAHVSLSNRLWAVGVLAVGGIVTALISVFTKGH